MPATLPHRFRLKPDALDRMADAIGAEAYRGGHDGRPNRTIMLGASARSTASKMLAGIHEPSSDAVATMTKRHAANRNIPWTEALAELFEIVPAQVESADLDAAEQTAEVAA